jgi:capsular polysaccharide biosynthesis protein
LDFLPRLDVLTQVDPGKVPILADHIPEWAHHFLGCFDIDRSRLRRHPARAFRVRNALVPSSAKSGYRLGASALKAAWQRVRHVKAASLPAGIAGSKIFFSRKQWAQTTRRSFSNIHEIEAVAEARGYKVVTPEQLSIPEQIALMEQARVVVGEDGSALHNIVFAEPGARLGVLSLPDRANLWHYGICHILGHRLAYFYSRSETEPSVDIAAFHDFLDVLET